TQIPFVIKDSTGRDAVLNEAKFNPYTLELDLQGFEIQEHNSQRFAGFDRLYVNYGLWDSVSHLSAALQQILIQKPYGHIAILEDGSFNFSDMSGPPEEELPEEEDDDGLFPVWIGNLTIEDGSVKFEDHSLKTAYTKEIQHISLSVDEFSTKKDAESPYVIGLKLATGAAIKLTGNTSLDPLKAEGDLELSGLKTPIIWEYIRDTVDFEIKQGLLDIKTHVKFDGSMEQTTLVNLSQGEIGLRDFQLFTTDQQPIQIKLAGLDLKDIAVNVNNTANEQLLEVVIPTTQLSETSLALPGNDALSINIPTLNLTETGLQIKTDSSQTTTITLNNQQTSLSKLGIKTSGTRDVFVDIENIDIGQLAMNSVSGSDAQSVNTLNNDSIQIQSTRIGSTTDNTPVIEIPTLDINQLSIDLKHQTVNIKHVDSKQAKVDSWMPANGLLNLQTLFAGQPQTGVTPPSEDTQATDKTDQSWLVAVDKLSVNGYQFNFEDRNTKPAASIAINPINLSIEKFSTDFSKPFQLTIDTTINQNGKLTTNGSLAIDPLNAQLNIKASKIALNALQPYINDFSRLKLKNGQFNLNGALNLAKNKADKTTGRFKGNANIARLRTINALNKKDFLKWRAFNVNGIDVHLEPLRVAIRDVVADKLYSRVIINKDKTSNLNEIFSSEEKKPSTPNNKQNVAAKQSKSKTVPVKIGSVNIKNGAALFSDLSLVLPFALNMTDLNGTIKGINSNLKETATVRVDGKVNRISPVVIDGSLKPFDISKFMDIRLNLDGVDLTAITPYMAQFAGYEIEKGKINLDVEYKIKDKALIAKNKIVIDQLTLGDEIDSPDAVSLPVSLAIGLLQDQNGVIDLDLPMQGSLDDPEFSIASLIGKVLVNLLTKAATSPFSLLGGLVGDDSSNLSAIEFVPGRSQLQPSEIEKLAKISDALKSRPKLNIELKGYALSETDRMGLKEYKLLNRMQTDIWKDIKDDDNAPADISSVQLSNAQQKELILDYYDDDIPDAKSPEMVETESGDEIVSEQFYQMAKQALIDQIQVTELDLQVLAQERAGHIADQLIQIDQLPANRVFVLKESVQSETEPSNEQTVTMELSLKSS
nr:DUF748 domain-containing protein [Gammaproteobacteria bacterium]